MAMSKEEKKARREQASLERRLYAERFPFASVRDADTIMTLQSGEDRIINFSYNDKSAWNDITGRPGWKSTSLLMSGDVNKLAHFIFALSCRLKGLTEDVNASISKTETVLNQAKLFSSKGEGVS